MIEYLSLSFFLFPFLFSFSLLSLSLSLCVVECYIIEIVSQWSFLCRYSYISLSLFCSVEWWCGIEITSLESPLLNDHFSLTHSLSLSVKQSWLDRMMKKEGFSVFRYTSYNQYQRLNIFDSKERDKSDDIQWRDIQSHMRSSVVSFSLYLSFFYLFLFPLLFFSDDIFRDSIWNWNQWL